VGSRAAFLKDPADVLDYQINWSAWLGSDTISTSTWAVPAGITRDSDTHSATEATIWLSGGTAGVTYQCSNRITTAGGRTAERSLQITVRDA
jgi:hypothetical protein